MTVKKAYRTLSLLLHPDKFSQSNLSETTEKSKILNLVYSILMDPNRKELYDEMGIIRSDTDFILSDYEMKRAIKKYAGESVNWLFDAFIRNRIRSRIRNRIQHCVRH